MQTQRNTAKRNIQAKLLKALHNARLAAHSDVCIWREGDNGAGVGYREAGLATIKNVLLHALQLLQASNVQYDNLHTTDGSIDTSVEFTYANTNVYITTCYE